MRNAFDRVLLDDPFRGSLPRVLTAANDDDPPDPPPAAALRLARRPRALDVCAAALSRPTPLLTCAA